MVKTGALSVSERERERAVSRMRKQAVRGLFLSRVRLDVLVLARLRLVDCEVCWELVLILEGLFARS